ncbi:MULTISPECIES: biotin transporter BioY [Subtercola]|uniref:Biotin transporter n=1 Tax=Subtercola vilae TaxID=2056433 RepID=A0A4T2C8E4_9MICO|nr:MULTISPECIES: biotin transporter BioY [Subtercola]MEA9983740.1 biotin transporter BioY [Subtercola sp. RTI3]TIH40713.1 biotin transporter BioY [Subtercola vilae]
MSNSTLAHTRPTLADRVIPRSLVTDAALVLGGAAFTGILAQLAIPLWPVPITGQTLAVLLVGSSLGMLRGALAMVVYAVIGIIGVPWFSEGSSGVHIIAGPTGGYIIGFIAAAALTGWVAQRAWDHKFVGAFISFAGGTIVTFAIGMAWLAAVLGLNLQQTLNGGLYPFIVGGIVKAVIAAALIPLAWKFVTRFAKK